MDNNSSRRIQHKFCNVQYEYLLNHRLNGHPVIPGLTLVNLLRSYFDKEQLTLRNVNFHEIIPFSSTQAPVIEINFENLANEHKRQDDHQLSVTISNYGQNNSQILSAVLDCTINKPDISLPDHMKTSWDMITSVNVPQDEFYLFMSSRGYEYSIPFCSVVSVSVNGIAPDKSIGSCKLMPTTKLDVIIDGLLQAMVFTILRRIDQKQMIVPFCIGNLRFEGLLQHIVIDTSKWTFLFEVNPQTFIGNCTIFESSTNLTLFTANNMLFRPVNRLEPINMPKPMLNLSKTTTNAFGIRSIACRLPPNISSASEFWQFLVEFGTADGRIPASRIHTRNNLLKDGLVEGGHFLCQDVAAFDAAFFGISRVEAEAMDPQQRFLLECVYECMENGNQIDLTETGFFIGFMGSEYMDLPRAEQQSALTMLGSSYSIVSGRLSHFYNSRGPSITVDTACSSSLVAMDLAIQAINAGRCSRAIVAGVNIILTEKGLRQRANGKMLAWDGCCRTFDANASGYGRADGCVVMLLEKITKENYHLFEAEIQAVEVNHDGKSTALTAPNPAAQAELIAKCIRSVESDQLCFWECHGTGTALGDPIEFQALARSLNSQTKDVTISSAKASIGHSEAASGLVGVLKAIKQLQEKYVPAMPHFHVVNAQIKRPISALRISAIGMELDECDIISGGVCSFGIGGTNACAILSKTNVLDKYGDKLLYMWNSWIKVLPISGKSRISLERNINNYINCIEKPKESINVTPYCAAVALYRNHYQHRAAVTFGTGNSSKKIIKKTDTEDYRQGLVFEVGWWDDLNFDFLFKIPEYAKQFEKLIQAVGFDLTDLFEDSSNLDDKFKNGIVKVADSYAKFKSLIEFGVITKELYSQPNTTKFSENMKQMLTIYPESREEEKQLEKYFYRCMDSMKHDGSQSMATNGSYGKLRANTTEDFADVIATAYIQGVDLNWQKIYSPGFLSHFLAKVQLPNYAWDRKEFWSTPLSDQFDHPLVGNVTDVSESLTIFENLLSTRRLPFLKTVKYKKKSILTFGCVVEIIIASTFHHFERIGKSASSISIEKFHNENLYLPQETDVWICTAVKNYESAEIINNEQAVVVELSQTVPNSSVYYPMCSALVKKTCTVNSKRRDLPQPQQKLDLHHFNSIIAKNTGVEYRVDDVYIELDSYCNIARISTCQLTHQGFHIHPLLLEAFVQILQHYGTLQTYEEFEKKIKQIQISSDIRVNNLCYVNVEENVVESFDGHGNMIIRILVDVDSDMLIPTEDKIQNGSIEHSIITQEKSLDHETTCYPHLGDITNKVKEAVEDALSQEQQLAQTDFDTGFMDLGLDSLALIGFVNKLNESYFHGQLISSTDVFSYPTINALSSYIYQRQKDTTRSMLQSSNVDSCLSYIDAGSQSMELDLSHPKTGNSQKFTLSSHAYLIEESGGHNNIHVTSRPSLFVSVHNDGRNINVHMKKDAYYEVFVVAGHSSPLFERKVTELLQYSKQEYVSLSFVDDETNIIEASKFIRAFAKILVTSTSKIYITIPTSKGNCIRLNGMARGFFKSLAAEKRNKIIYDHYNDHQLNRLPDLKCALPRPAPSGNWLITGGTSGLGFEMLKYLVDHYHIECIVVISRKPFTGKYADEVSKLQRFCEIEFHAADVSNLDQMRGVFASVEFDICGRLDGVIHSAGVVQDALFECQTDATFEKVLNVKCVGLQNLEILLAEYKLSPRFFIINSSISSTLGNTGQTNYAAANSYVDEFIRHRRAKKLNGTSINWGNWLEVGMAERAGINASLKSVGFSGLTVNEAMIYFRYILESNPCVIAVAKIDWDILMKNRPDLHGILANAIYYEESMEKANEAKLENYKIQVQSSTKSIEPLSASKIRQNLNKMFTSKTDLEKYLIKNLHSFLANTAANQEDMIEINSSDGFMEVGFDSFRLYSLTTQLNSYLQSQYRPGFSLSVVDLFEHSTPAQLSEYILNNVKTDSTDYSNINEDAPEVLKEENSERYVSKIDMEYISDHIIGEQVVVPAAYQIHCLENHFASSVNGIESQVMIENITFTQIMTEKHLMSLVTTASPSKLNSDIFNVALTSCEKTFSTGNICSNSIKCANGFKHHEIKKFISDIFNDSNGIPTDVNNFYREMSNNGVKYGDSMRLLKNMKVNHIQNTVIGKVVWNHGMPIWLLYELALQALSMALFDERMTYYYVPTFIKTHTKNLAHIAKTKEVSVYGKVFQKNVTYVEGSVAVETSCDSYLFLENIRAVKMYREPSDKEPTGLKIYEDMSKREENYEPQSPSSDEELSQYFDSSSPTIYANENMKYKQLHKDASQVEQKINSETNENFKTFQNSSSIIGRNVVQKLEKLNLKEEITQVGDTIAPAILPSMYGKILVDDLGCPVAKCSDKNGKTNYDLQNASNDYPICPRKQSQIDVIIRGWNQSTFKQPTVLSSETKFSKAIPKGLPPVEDFDCQFFNITPNEAPFVDPQQRWLLEAVVETMEHAAISTPIDPNTGVFIGCSSSDFAQKIHSELDCCNLSAYLAAGTNGSVLAGRLAHFFGFTGPVMTFDTGCSSFGVALATACDALVDRKCRFALVGAVNVILNEKTSQTLNKCGMLSPQHRCATFDADADGYLRGEGVAMVLIEGVDLEHNDKKIHLAELKEVDEDLKTVRITGWSSGHTGGDSAALTVPSTAAQCRVMKSALEMASRNGSVELEPIDLVECHGSGTALGDPIEFTSILDVFTGSKQESLTLTASKTRFGHCEAAAGGMSLVNLLNNIQDEYIPPISHFKLMNTHIRELIAARNGKDFTPTPSVLVPIVGVEFKISRAMVNSFGFSGVNTAVFIEATENKTSSKQSDNNSYPSELLAFSAKSEESLRMMIEAVETFLQSHMPFIAVLFQKLQANHGKPHYFYRHTRIVNRINDSTEILEEEPPKSNVTLLVDSVRNAEIALAELLQNHRGFRENWDKISTADQPDILKLNLLEKIILSFVKFFVNCNFQLKHIFVEDPIDANILPRNLCSVTTFTKEYKGLLNDPSSRLIRFSDIFQINETQYERPSLRLNRLFGQLFMAKFHFNLQSFEPETSQHQLIPDLPGYKFDRKRYWPFDEISDLERISEKRKHEIITTSHSCMDQRRISSHVGNLQYQTSSTPSTSSNRPGTYKVMEENQDCDALKVRFEKSHPIDELDDIFYQLYYQPQMSEVARLEHENHSFGLLDFIGCVYNSKFTTIKIDMSLDAAKIDVGSLLENKISDVVIFWQSIQCELDKDIRRGIHNFTNLSQLFIQWPRKRPLRLVTIVPNAKTTEFGAFIRSVVAEYKNVSYIVVCLEEVLKNYDLDNIIETQFSLLTCIEASDILRIANDGTIYAERLDRAVQNSKLIEEDSTKNMDCSREKVLITGGLGGIGQEIIKGMKATEFVVVSRGANTKSKSKYYGKIVKEYTSSCEEKEQLRNVFKQESGINTVIHCAGVVRNSLIKNLTDEAWNEVFKTKVTGTKNLLDLCEEFAVPNFIAISSVASIFGSIGQCNYAVANFLMTKMCFDREKLRTKIKNISVKTFGPWAEVGMLAGKEKSSIRKQICDSGWDFIKPSVGVKIILKKLKPGSPHTRAHGITFLGDWSKLLRQQKHLAKLISPVIVSKDIHSYDDKMLETANGNIKQLIVDKIREVSGIMGTIDINVGLMSLGVDSLMIEKLRTTLCEVFEAIEITPAEMYEYVSVKELCKMVDHKLSMKYFPIDDVTVKDKGLIYNQELTTKSEVKSDLNEGKQKSDFTSLERPEYTEFIEENDIAIISMSGSFSGCESVEELWNGLLKGKELTSTISNNSDNNSDQDNFDNETDVNAFIPVSGSVPNTEKFDSALFQLSQEDATQLDFQTKNFLQHAYLCLEKSGYIREKRKYKIGCFVGAEPMPASEMNIPDENRGSLINMYKQNQKDFIAMWTSHILDINGPSAAVYSACSSSLLAIRYACDTIQHRHADLCLAGAVHLVHPEDAGHHFQPGMVLSSTSHCRPFSFSSDGGIIRGSACAAVLLKDAKNAYLDGDNILGVIKSCRINNDGGRGNKSNFMAPSLRGQTESMRSVFAECTSVTPNDIAYLEAHGTGTPVGDSIEIKAMTDVYGKREKPLTIGSIKANIGDNRPAKPGE
ncbi:KR domain-containing protein [Ditylenchus destructor]|uniref:KR domain-containing protein n=1 Tax=Ditylenchus destructor TaxID=166010 RepID=A0AAD4R962_9BILA|nr:KR domain-containing protein [Ditylenchus destructor]